MRELQFDALEEHLKKITYKPSWQFRIEPLWNLTGDLVLIVTFHTLDTYANQFGDHEIELRKEVKIGMRHRLRGPFLDFEQFERAVLDATHKCERHETREWFKVDGVMKFDPHK